MKRTMSMLALAVVATAGLSSFPGCETLTETSGQNANMIKRDIYISGMQITDDVDMILLFDHPSWLSRKPMPAY